jgi:CDP-paratose 2-epimerase
MNKDTIIVTGSAGLIGGEAARFFHQQGFNIIGIDNDKRAYFFGDAASTRWQQVELEKALPNYAHANIDITNADALESIFKTNSSSIKAIIHCAAQPSHDWAAKEPLTDFDINARATLLLLECTRKYAANAVFIFTSTNKVYGDQPNQLPIIEKETRWELDPSHKYALNGIDEQMSIDQSTHSIFGVSKAAADLMVQEYGKYFGIKTVAFRGGCLTGPSHSGAELHGFLAYLVNCAVNKKKYTVFGYKGKQVRDNIHSADLIAAFWEVYQKPPTPGSVYNMGGSRHSNISMLEAINWLENKLGYSVDYTIDETKARKGDHIWYISDVSKFQNDYPNWKYKYSIEAILEEMVTAAQKKK